MHRSQLTRTARIVAALLVAATIARPAVSYAQCDANTEARLDFLETRLDEAERPIDWWWGAWMGVFTIGTLYGITTGVLEDNNEKGTAHYITAGKSALGVAQLLIRPYAGRHGSKPMQAIPKTSPETCTQRLRLAESNMESSAKDSNMRRSFVRHFTSFVLNLGLGLVVVEALDEPGQGWSDFAISEVSSEAFIFTYPTRAREDWAEYRAQYSGTRVSGLEPRWDFAVKRGGIGIVYKF